MWPHGEQQAMHSLRQGSRQYAQCRGRGGGREAVGRGGRRGRRPGPWCAGEPRQPGHVEGQRRRAGGRNTPRWRRELRWCQKQPRAGHTLRGSRQKDRRGSRRSPRLAIYMRCQGIGQSKRGAFEKWRDAPHRPTRSARHSEQRGQSASGQQQRRLQGSGP